MANVSEAVPKLDRDLRELFGARVKSIVAYGPSGGGTPVSTLAVVDGLTADDLRSCASRVAQWHDAGLATPLLMAESEFGRALDVFPLEFGEILASYEVISGVDPFERLQV